MSNNNHENGLDNGANSELYFFNTDLDHDSEITDKDIETLFLLFDENGNYNVPFM